MVQVRSPLSSSMMRMRLTRGLQLLATDGALFGLLVRTSTEQFRLSYIHAWFPPLAISPSLPLSSPAVLLER